MLIEGSTVSKLRIALKNRLSRFIDNLMNFTIILTYS